MVDLGTAVTVVDAAGRAGVPVLLLSDPGMGKSSIVRALAAADGVPCETVIGSIREPTDVGGMPLTRENDFVLVPPAWAQRLQQEGCGYLFLDELTTCSPSVQAAMLSVALDRTVGELQLPPGVRVVAAANPAGSAAGGWDLEPPLANRFLHLPFTPSVDDWLDGMATGWATTPPSRAVPSDKHRAATAVSAVYGFIKARPGHLDMFAKSESTSGAWASRRTWDMVAKTLAHLNDDDNDARSAVVLGLVGEGAGTEFLTWLAKADLPDPGRVVEDPSIMDWTDRPDRVWAVLSGVTAWATSQGTVTAWKAAWGPMAAAAKAGVPDVAGAAARTLAKTRPARASIPAAARVFQPVLKAAGLMNDGGDPA
jgi:hypothetical protein